MEKSGTIMHGAEMHLDASRRVFIPPTGVYGASAALGGMYGYYAAAMMANSEDDRAYANIKVPSNYVSDGVLSAIVIPGAAGDLYGHITATYASSGEAYDTNMVSTSTVATTLESQKIAEIWDLTLTDLTASDLIGCGFYRFASHAEDTVEENVGVLAFVLSYMADQ